MTDHVCCPCQSPSVTRAIVETWAEGPCACGQPIRVYVGPRADLPRHPVLDADGNPHLCPTNHELLTGHYHALRHSAPKA